MLIYIASSKEFFEDFFRIGSESIFANEVAILQYAFLQLLLSVLVVDLLLLT